jgi:hypothetical protein
MWASWKMACVCREGVPSAAGPAGRALSKGLYAHPSSVAATVTHIVEAGAMAGGYVLL